MPPPCIPRHHAQLSLDNMLGDPTPRILHPYQTLYPFSILALMYLCLFYCNIVDGGLKDETSLRIIFPFLVQLVSKVPVQHRLVLLLDCLPELTVQ